MYIDGIHLFVKKNKAKHYSDDIEMEFGRENIAKF